jgi:hypothetical protein
MNPGWIYILTNRSLQSNYLKIGRTVNDPSERASEISSVTGVAVPFSVAHSEAAPDCVRAEWLIHQKLASYRVNANREFFQVDFNIAQRAVSEMCEIVRNEVLFARNVKQNQHYWK